MQNAVNRRDIKNIPRGRGECAIFGIYDVFLSDNKYRKLIKDNFLFDEFVLIFLQIIDCW